MGIAIHNLLGSSMFRPMSLSLLGEPEGVIHCRNEQIRSQPEITLDEWGHSSGNHS